MSLLGLGSYLAGSGMGAYLSADHLSKCLLPGVVDQSMIVQVGSQAAGVDLRIRNRLDHAFATKLFVQAVDVLFLASGRNAIYLNKPIQQLWRDIHAAGVHISLNWGTVGTMYGQHALGLDPKGQF